MASTIELAVPGMCSAVTRKLCRTEILYKERTSFMMSEDRDVPDLMTAATALVSQWN